MSLWPWLIIALLIVVNALYVAAEFAAVGVRRGPVRELARDGNRFAAGLLPVIEDTHKLDNYIAACQIGITLSSLILGAFGQAALTLDFAALLRAWAGLGETAAVSVAATTVLVFLTGLQVVLGELVPKSLALQYPTPVAIWTYLPMRWSLALFSWFIVVLNGSGLALVKMLGFPPGSGHRHIHSPEEIEMLVVESSDGGLLEPEERERLRRALRVGRRTARDLMVPRRSVQMIDAETPPDELLGTIMESPYTRLPVFRGTVDDVIGFIHTRDAAVRVAEGRPLVIGEMLQPIRTIPSLLEFERLLPALRQRGQRIAVVLDEFGGVEGIVTLQDLMAELLGDMADEFSGPDERAERLPDGRVRMPGAMRLDEAAALIGVDWRDGDVSTLAGYVILRLGRIPAAGECTQIDGVGVEIERVDQRAITSLLIAPAPAPPAETTTD